MSTLTVWAIYEEVLAERARQAEKWGSEARQIAKWGDAYLLVKGLVLGEECGEVCRAVLDPLDATGAPLVRGDLGHLRAEAIQVAAVAIALVEGIDLLQAPGAPP